MKGFTLLEILIVIIIISLFFGVAISSYIFIVNKSLKTIKNSNKTYKYTYTIYTLEKSINCAKDIKIDNSKDNSVIYLYTYCGIYPGLSKEVFFIKNNYLYVYSYPYIIGDMTFYEQSKATKLIKANTLKAKFIPGPKKIINLNLDGLSLNIPILASP